jgi:hypothetical protein
MRKYLPLFILFSLITLSIQGQNRFSIAPTYWFNYGQYNYQLRSTHTGRSLLGYSGSVHNSSFGLTVRYTIGRKWDLSTGLLYNVVSQYSGGRKFTDDYVRLPVLVSYRLSDKRLSPYASVGASFSNEYQFSNNGGIKTNALLGIGATYRLHSKISLLVQPTVSYLLNRPRDQGFQDEFDKYYFYQVGLQTQLVWHL